MAVRKALCLTSIRHNMAGTIEPVTLEKPKPSSFFLVTLWILRRERLKRQHGGKAGNAELRMGGGAET